MKEMYLIPGELHEGVLITNNKKMTNFVLQVSVGDNNFKNTVLLEYRQSTVVSDPAKLSLQWVERLPVVGATTFEKC